jgi:ferrous iron transport protein A
VTQTRTANNRRVGIARLLTGTSDVPIIPLELLAAGERARIVEIDGDNAFVNRLNEMGLDEDVEIKMVQSGSPCIIALDNHRLSFRGEESGMIFVDTD